GQAIGPLPAGVAEGSCQVLHRENRLPVPGGVGAVNTVPVNGYLLGVVCYNEEIKNSVEQCMNRVGVARPVYVRDGWYFR
ncbi:DUF4433 domain-containing protein, partial [Aeromonas veronii]|nr:DUF4433 domain-containing protein [Aeromonas veronii]